MLDTRYFIFADQEHGLQYQKNSEAFGPAWFVNDIRWVTTADEEMSALDDTPLRTTAVADKRFEGELSSYKAAPATATTDSLATDSLQPAPAIGQVELLSYAPSQAKYRVTTDVPRLLVFSEIYYPHGWHLTLDGKSELPLVRANYTLRAAYIPAGTHELTMTFDPASIHHTELVAKICTALLALLLLASLVQPFLKRKDKKATTPQH